jgi:tetratricopeptide (TPR) repeat protein
MLGDTDAAIEWFLRSLEKNPGAYENYAFLAMAYTLNGEDAKARAAMVELRRLAPNLKLSAFWYPIPSGPAAYKEWFESRLVPAWRKAGLPE